MNQSSHRQSASILAARDALAKGDVETTERLCRTVVEAFPQQAEAWMLLAETALIRNRLDAARVCAERASRLAPKHITAQIVLAKTLLRSGEILDALEAAERASELYVDEPGAADALAGIFGLLGRHRQALPFSHRAIAGDVRVAQFFFNLAATERMLGLLEEAEEHCDAAIACNPEYVPAYYIRSDLRVQSQTRNHISQMERLIAKGILNWRYEATLRYSLAKEYEDVGEDARAFENVGVGARLWRENISYDASEELAQIDHVIETQDERWIGTFAGAGNPADAPIFVCGLPRTGTTLVERIISGNSEVGSVGETGIFAIEAARVNRAGGDATRIDVLGGRYLSVIDGVFNPMKRRYVDKTLQNYLNCGLIHAAFPNAKIILIERDPMDTAWALFKAHFNGRFLYSYVLEELADYYSAYQRLVKHWQRTLPKNAVMTVSYEDIVKDLRAEGRRIADFLNLDWQESMLEFHASPVPSATASAVQVRRPIYSSSIGKWRRHADALAPFAERLSKRLESASLIASAASENRK